MDTRTAVARIARFEDRFAKAQASEVVELGWGYVLLQKDFPASWHHNRVVVTAAVEPAEVIAAADLVLGGSGLGHRLVHFADAVQGANAADAFAAAGYGTHERIITMIHSGPVPEPGDGRVAEIDFAELRPSLVADWRAEFPDEDDATIDQLADRVRLYDRGAAVTFLGVRDGTDIVARGELYIADGVAQFENVITRRAHRGRGHARALVAEALRRGADSDIRYLIAEATDWPRDWYRRMGYGEAAEAHLFQRSP